MITVLAVDVGGTNIRLAIVSDKGEILEAVSTPAHFSKRNISAEELLSTLASAFLDFLDNKANVAAIGIGFPGFFLGNSGVLSSSPNLPLLKEVDLGKAFSNTLELPVVVQNDALCAAIGEHRFGAGMGRPNMIHITLGTGIGAGLILNYLPYTGEDGTAMEFGHLRINPDDHARVCGCGNTGCLEAYASASAVVSQFEEKSGIRMEAKEIYQHSLNGNKQAKEILLTAGAYLGAAIAEVVKILDIRYITISGGLSGAWPILYPILMKHLNSRVIPPLKGKITVVRSQLDDNSGLLGAAALAFNINQDFLK